MDTRLRSQVLAEWRGYREPLPPRPLVRVGDPLRAIVQKYAALDMIDEAALQAAWRSIVGDFLADHSTPGRFRDSTLTVQVSQPGVLYELDRVWKSRILTELRSRFPKIRLRAVRFTAG